MYPQIDWLDEEFITWTLVLTIEVRTIHDHATRRGKRSLASGARLAIAWEESMLIDDLFDVRNLVVVITGGAGGIGFACADVLADNGAKVVLVDREEERLDKAVAMLRDRGDAAEGVCIDLLDRPALKNTIDQVVAQHGRLDVAFANAGISGGPGFLSPGGARNSGGGLTEVPDELWDRVIEGNLTSVVATIQAAAPHMKRQNAGRIIVTTSVAGIKTENFVGYPYIAAKAALAHLVHQCALELARYNVQVNAIAPGPFLTTIGENRMADPTVRRAFESVPLLHRMAQSSEIQGLALLLASPASSYMTGAQFAIDGGATAGHVGWDEGALEPVAL
jgi:NAD(P)-dependent dehydrogenase (short-subunit alcohol dehydrogenase family)